MVPISAKKRWLKLHEARELMKKKKYQLSEEEAKKKVNAIVPWSDEMIVVLERQMAILNKE